MKFETMRKAFEDAAKVLDLRREYRLDDNHTFTLKADVSYFRRRRPDVAVEDILLSVHIEGHHGEIVDLIDIPPIAIRAAAEVRSMIDDWVSGKLDTLPPSNVPAPNRYRRDE